VRQNHWNCFFVNRNDGDFVYLDPYGAKDELVMQCTENWRFLLFYLLLFTIILVYCAKYLELLSSGSLNLKFPSTYPALAKIRSEMYTVLLQSK